MKLLVPALVLSLALGSGGASAGTIWQCEVLHAYDLSAKGVPERDATSPYLGTRFTANDETGEVTGPHLGEARDWKPIARRFAASMDGLQVVRSSDGRPVMHLYVETFAAGPAKPFLIGELDIGAARSGLCRAGG